MPHATMLTASLLGLFYLYLTLAVINRRRRYRIPYGMGDGHPDLKRAIMAHSNFQQYTPFFLILLYLEETSSPANWLCYVLGGIFLLGRIAHAYSMRVAEPDGIAAGARNRIIFRFRFYAMVQTITCYFVLSALLLAQSIAH